MCQVKRARRSQSHCTQQNISPENVEKPVFLCEFLKACFELTAVIFISYWSLEISFFSKIQRQRQINMCNISIEMLKCILVCCVGG